jgi:hypothetical protein
MADIAMEQHRARWMHNREFIGTLQDKYCDWMLTGAFYAAVHAVETLMAFDGLPNNTSHESRNEVLKKTNRYKQIWKFYHPLYNASQTTRYHCAPNEWIPVTQVKTEWIPHYLVPLEKSVQKLIGEATPLPAITWGNSLPTA